ncbi:MAG: hypothetical protein V4622_03220 [Bacteroidota bacterium]
MQKKILFSILLLISIKLQAQTNTGSFLLFRSYGTKTFSLILESEIYLRHQKEIKIDSTKLLDFGKYEVLIMSNRNKTIQKYAFDDSSALKLGKLKDSLTEVDFRYGMGADLHFSLKMADSLLKNGVYFYTVPELDVKETFELNFSAQFKPKANEYSYNDEDEDPLYLNFIRAFHKDYAHLGKKNIHGYKDKKGEDHVLLYLKNPDFDLKKLDKYKLNYTKKPKIRPRFYEIIILE